MKASEMDKGKVVKLDGKLYTIVDFEHVKLGKGGAVYQTRLKSLADGSIQNARIRSEETIEDVELDKRKYEYLYSSGGENVLMDTISYDQITLDDDAFGDVVKYLKPNMQLQVSMYDGKAVAVELPITVEMAVTDTPPEIKAATAVNQYKPATLETGLVVQVPPFIKVGDIIRIDTRNGKYMTRAK